MRTNLWIRCVTSFLAVCLVGSVAFAETYNLKLSTYVPPNHDMSKYLTNWAKALEVKSGGRLKVDVFHAAQMGPPPRQYDLARTGVADIVWFMHGATPGRFPLTELLQLPCLFDSAETATRVANDPEVRAVMDPEHQGVKVLYLFSNQPAQLHTTKRPVRTLADFKGLRVRFPSVPAKELLTALEATPMGIPTTELSESLAKGTIDGAIMDYGGAHTAFKFGGMIKYVNELKVAVTSFGLVMNPESYRKLPADLQKLIDDTARDAVREVGKIWDASDGPGRQYLVAEGAQVLKLSDADDASFKRLAAQIAEARVKILDAEGKPGRKVYDLLLTKARK